MTRAVLFLCALVLYAPAVNWGLPPGNRADAVRSWSPDDITPVGPALELSHLLRKNDYGYLAYPMMHNFVLGAAYSPYVAWLAATGKVERFSGDYPYGLREPESALASLTLIARLVTLLMAAGTVVAAFEVGRTLWDRTRGILAAVFVMLLYPMFYYSRTGNLDVPMLFWGSLGIAVFAKILRQGWTVRRAVWLGLFAALSAGTKDQGAGLFLLMPLALIPMYWKAWRAPAVTLLAGALAYVVASGMIFWPARYFAHVGWIAGMRPDSPGHFGRPATLAGFWTLAGDCATLLANSMSAPLAVAAIAGLVLALFRDRLSLALLVPAVGSVLLVIAPIRVAEMRYLLPFAFVLACFAAYAIGELRNKRGAITIAAALCFLPAARGMDLTKAMLDDSRYAAAGWLNGRLRAGDRVAYFGPRNKLPLVPGDVEVVRVVPSDGTDKSARPTASQIREWAALIAESGAAIVVVMPDHSSTVEHPYGTTCPTALYNLLRDGSLGYRLAAEFHSPPLLAWSRRPALDYPSVNPPVEAFERVALESKR